MTRMDAREFSFFLRRDGHCLHCGREDDTLVPNHRASRGMGGSKRLEKPANIVVLCSEYNGLIESNSICALEAKQMGWKLERHQDSETEPVFDTVTAQWYYLRPDYTRELAQVDPPPLSHDKEDAIWQRA